MDKFKLAQLLAESIVNQDYQIQPTIKSGDSKIGIKTEKMCVIEISFPIIKPVDRNLFGIACELFPKKNNQSLLAIRFEFLPEKSNISELVIGAHYPLPYKSAERVKNMKKPEFLKRMTLHLIYVVIRKYLHGDLLASCANVTQDPRCDWEQWINKKKLTIKAFLKMLLTVNNKPKMTFDDYL